MDTLLIDIRHALRGLAKARGFTAAVVGVLAVGIGATTAMFSIVYGVLLKPLPFADPARLVSVETVVRDDSGSSALPDVQDWRAKAASFDGLAAYATNAVTLTGAGEPTAVPVAVVSGDFFRVLGVAPVLGRPLDTRDDEKGAPAAVVISERLWQSRFSRDPNIVGRAIALDGAPSTVVGVMPASFEFPFDSDRVDAWIPVRALKFTAQLADERGAAFVQTIGRLAARRGVAEAEAELDVIEAALAREYPASNQRRIAVRVTPLQTTVAGNYRLGLVVLLGAVGAVLLIACANVANLLLARGAARRKEMALRRALGASRGRLAWQLLAESLAIALAAGIAGVVLAVWGVRALVAASPVEIPRLNGVHVDGAVLVFALAASLATGLLFGLAPAVQGSHANALDGLKAETRGSSGSSARTRRVLVVAEVALSMVLLVSAGLLGRSLLHLHRTHPGFAADHAIGMFLTLSDARYPDAAERAAFARRVVEELRAVPGVESAAVSSTLPLSGSNVDLGFEIDGRAPDPAARTAALAFAVSSDYFRTMRIPVVRGRAFTERDSESAPAVVIVSESFARRYWPAEDALGKRLRLRYGKTGAREVVGVVADVKQGSLADRPEPQMYTPFVQTPWPFVAPVVRTAGDPTAVMNAVRAALGRVDPETAVEVRTLDEYVSRTVATPRFTAALAGGFAATALLLAAIGLYAVMAYSVVQRRREIGIRMALGADPSRVKSEVLSEALRLGATGIVLGMAAAVAAARVLRTLLFGVTATDPATFAAVAGLLVAVLLVAAYMPARRATRVDPMVALQAE